MAALTLIDIQSPHFRPIVNLVETLQITCSSKGRETDMLNELLTRARARRLHALYVISVRRRSPLANVNGMPLRNPKCCFRSSRSAQVAQAPVARIVAA